MAIYNFAPSSGATVGHTTAVVTASTVGSTSAVVTVTSTLATAMLVTNTGSVPVFVRMSLEAAPVASVADTPMLPNTSRIFATPAPLQTGKIGVAVIQSSATACTVYFTPGTGGV